MHFSNLNIVPVSLKHYMSDSAFGFGGISSHSNTESQDEHHISLVNRTVKWSNPVRTKWCRFSSLPASQISHTNDAMLYLGNEHMQIAAKTPGTPLSNQHCHLDNFMTADGCPPVCPRRQQPLGLVTSRNVLFVRGHNRLHEEVPADHSNDNE